MKWLEYNESFVRRGENLLGFDVIDTWDKELQVMNSGKIGEPFHHPTSFFLMLGYAKAYFHLPYRQTDRQTEGIVKGHVRDKIPSIHDFNIINSRMNSMDVKIENDCKNTTPSEQDKYIVIAIDSIGIKVTYRGQWMNKKWNNHRRKGYLNQCCSGHKKQENSIHDGSDGRAYVHDGKILLKLVDGVMSFP